MTLHCLARITLACATVVTPMPLRALAVSDSTTSSRELAARVAIISAHQLETELDTRLRLGLPMERLPDPSNAAALAEGSWARAQLQALGRLKAVGLTQEEQITLRYLAGLSADSDKILRPVVRICAVFMGVTGAWCDED